MTNKGCGTCKDRKVRCDRAIPVCQRCYRTNRECKGYSITLSWPKEKDRRRAIIGSHLSGGARKAYSVSIVNASSWDIEMFYYISSFGQDGRVQFLPPVIPVAISWNPVNLNLQSRDLLQYFETVASYSVATFGRHATDIRNILLRMSFSDGSLTSKAVMQSMLAVSSLHRFGPRPQAINFKQSALRTLAESLATGIGTKGALQHIAAGMLLCTFEAQQATDTSGQWIWHLFGVKDVIRAAKLLEESLHNSEFIELLLWVQYHETLSSFSLVHWRRYAAAEDAYVKDIGEQLVWLRSRTCFRLKMPDRVPLSHEILGLLLEGCDYNLKHSAFERNYSDYRSYLISLQMKLLSIPIPDIPNESIPIKLGTQSADVADMELYRLATMIYLGRAADSLGQEHASKWIRKAFNTLQRLDAYYRPFPLLIFGLEATTDDQRIALFDLISRTENNMPMRSLSFIRLMIQAVWVQDDLTRREVGYMDRLSVILSSNETLPTFV